MKHPKWHLPSQTGRCRDLGASAPRSRQLVDRKAPTGCLCGCGLNGICRVASCKRPVRRPELPPQSREPIVNQSEFDAAMRFNANAASNSAKQARAHCGLSGNWPGSQGTIWRGTVSVEDPVRTECPLTEIPSVLDPEVPDAGDPVAVGIGDGEQLHALVHSLNRSWSQAPPADLGDVPVQVVHRQFNRPEPARSGARVTWTQPLSVTRHSTRRPAIGRLSAGRPKRRSYQAWATSKSATGTTARTCSMDMARSFS